MVDGALYKMAGRIRVCNYCFKQQLWRVRVAARTKAERASEGPAETGQDEKRRPSEPAAEATIPEMPTPRKAERTPMTRPEPSSKRKASGSAAGNAEQDEHTMDNDNIIHGGYTFSTEQGGTGDTQGAVIAPAPSLLVDSGALGTRSVVPTGKSPTVAAARAPKTKASLEALAQAHLRFLVSRLVCREGIRLEWRDVILKFCSKSVKCVKVSARKGDGLSLERHVKIKTMSGGCMSESRFIDGIAFRKNVSHRRMKTRITNARILLLSCPIEFQGERVEMSSQLSSLGTLIDQEKLHLKLLVDKIARLSPDVLVVQKGVSRLAQEAILDAGIVLVINVKEDTMRRIARATGAHILRSPDYAENSLMERDQLLGKCQNFRVLSVSNENKIEKLMVFSGCRSHRHGTIVLRGDQTRHLKSVKKILRQSLTVAHNLHLETKFLHDEGATYADADFARLMSFYGAQDDRFDAQFRNPETEYKKKMKATIAAKAKYGPAGVDAPREVPIPRDNFPTDQMWSAGQAIAAVVRAKTRAIRDINAAIVRDDGRLPPATELLLSMSPHISIPYTTGDEKLSPEDAYCKHMAKLLRVGLGWVLRSLSYCKFSRLTHSWQCEAPRETGRVFYGPNDISLGRFLDQSCFNMNNKCPNPKCRQNMLFHNRYVTHGNGRLHFTVRLLEPKTAAMLHALEGKERDEYLSSERDRNSGYYKRIDWKDVQATVSSFANSEAKSSIRRGQILVCSRCKECQNRAHVKRLSPESYNLSFGKFLDLTFNNPALVCTRGSCMHSLHSSYVRRFIKGNMVAQFHYEKIRPYRVDFEPCVAYDRTKTQLTQMKRVERVARVANALTGIFKKKIQSIKNELERVKDPGCSVTVNAMDDFLREIDQSAELLAKDVKAMREEPPGTPSFRYTRMLKLIYSRFHEWNHTLRCLLKVFQSKHVGASAQPALVIVDYPSDDAKRRTSSSGSGPATQQRQSGDSTGGDARRRSSGASASEPTAPEGAAPAAPPNAARGILSLCGDATTVEFQAMDPALTPDDVEFLESGYLVNPGRFGAAESDEKDPHVPCRVHMNLPRLVKDTQVPIYDDEISSIIAYTLASLGHASELQSHVPASAAAAAKAAPSASPEPTKSTSATSAKPTTKRSHDIFTPAWYGTSPAELEKILRSDTQYHYRHVFTDAPAHGTNKTNPSSATSFECNVICPRKFHALRHIVCGGEAKFVESLMRCRQWNATGGKSDATFSMTHCERYVLKVVSKSEFKMFTELSSDYFKFMAKATMHGLPTVMNKILGCYTLSWKKASGHLLKTQYVFVLPNVFYARSISHTFDLKGSLRNRYVKTKPGEKRVLMDENFLEYTRGFPIPLEEKSKDEMRHAIRNDSKFLRDAEIVDYSVLVGLNEKTRRMSIGIIDYVRQYTWERRIETGVKSVGMIAGKASPTVISPDNYKVRFQLATERYFMMAPCQTSRAGLTKIIEKLSKDKKHAKGYSREAEKRSKEQLSWLAQKLETVFGGEAAT